MMFSHLLGLPSIHQQSILLKFIELQLMCLEGGIARSISLVSVLLSSQSQGNLLPRNWPSKFELTHLIYIHVDSVILGHCVASIESYLPPNMVLMIQIVGLCKVEDCCLPPCSMFI